MPRRFLAPRWLAFHLLTLVLVAVFCRLGWWQVDVASGRTIGVMDTGFYEDTAEYNEATQISTPMQRIGNHPLHSDDLLEMIRACDVSAQASRVAV